MRYCCYNYSQPRMFYQLNFSSERYVTFMYQNAVTSNCSVILLFVCWLPYSFERFPIELPETIRVNIVPGDLASYAQARGDCLNNWLLSPLVQLCLSQLLDLRFLEFLFIKSLLHSVVSTSLVCYKLCVNLFCTIKLMPLSQERWGPGFNQSYGVTNLTFLACSFVYNF